jgi:hypothetical protein
MRNLTVSDQSESAEPGDGQMVAIATDAGVRWMICSRGVCLYDDSGRRLMLRYEALLEMQRSRIE